MRLISRLWGGLGNQLFIYASSVALAEKLRMPVRFDLTAFRDDLYGRTYQLHELDIKVKVATRLESFAFPGGARLLSFIARREEQRPLEERHYISTHTAIDSRMLECQQRRRWLYIEGYWQDYRFFDKNRMVFVELAQKAAEVQAIGMLAEQPKGVLGIHVRQQLDRSATGVRVSDLRPVLDRDYYFCAARAAVRMLPIKAILLFGDDIEFRRALAVSMREFSSANVRIMDGGSASADLLALASCDALVLSASTFAWWGGYLNPRSRLVIHPGIATNGAFFPTPPEWRVLGCGRSVQQNL